MDKKSCKLCQWVSLVLFVLVVASGFVWASLSTHSASKVIKKGKGGTFWVVNDGRDKVRVSIVKGSLDDYMDEENLNEVVISVEMTEELVQSQSGDHYHLEFTFGPDGAYFDPPMSLTIRGKYVDTLCEAWLFNEDGEAVDGTQHNHADKVVFEIPHFSNYSYDEYD